MKKRTTIANALILGAGLFALPAQAWAERPDWSACAGQAALTPNVPPGAMDHDPIYDEIVLDFADHLSDREVHALARSFGLNASLNAPSADEANLYVATVPEGAVGAVKACLERAHPEAFDAIEENFEYALFGGSDPSARGGEPQRAPRPNDPLYQFQWNFEQVGAQSAWAHSTGKGVVVAVIDTGVAQIDDEGRGIKAAKDLAGTPVVPGYDFVDKSDFVFDGHGHGTHVAGTIAQTTNNRYGVAGLAHGASIMGLRVLNSRGFGQVADIANAIRFSADNGAHVINMSLGGPLPSLVMKSAIKYAHKKGVTIVAAAGNSGRRSPSYPAAYDHVIAVAATQYDRHTTFYSQWGSFVDIAAPGGNTRVDQNGDGRPDGVMQETIKDGDLSEHDFLLYMGTSMASPHVAAGAAMLIAQGITHPDRVEQILSSTAESSQRDRFESERDYVERYGAGIMRVDRAAQAAQLGLGGARSLAGLLLALAAAFAVRRRDLLGLGAARAGSIAAVSAVSAGGLFFLPALLGADSAAVLALSRPLAELDQTLLGPGWHQSPLLASALIPLGAWALGGGHKIGRVVACGLALGMAGFLGVEAIALTSDVQLVPGSGLLDRAWLAANALLSGALGYYGMKRY